jgi:uncharacterized protein YneF (UPF0154 family)
LGIRNWISKLLGLVFNRSLFWKVGFIIGVCVLVNFALTFYFYFLLKEIMNNPSIATQKELRLDFERSLLLLIIFVFIFLIWGAFAFYYMVKRPLDRMRQKIAELITNPRASMVEMENISCFRAMDEIGSLACTVENLIQQFRDLEIYRHLIKKTMKTLWIYTRGLVKP